jgi:phosphatidate cytidylyltransferase
MNTANLAKRLLFAAWAIPCGWLVINANISIIPACIASRIFSQPNTVVYPGHICALLLVFLGAFEYLRMLSLKFQKNGFWLVYLWLALQMASHFEPKISPNMRLDSFVLFMIVTVEAVVWGKRSGRWRRASLLFSGTAFLSIAGFSMLAYYDKSFQTVFQSRFSHPLASQMGIVTVCAAIFLCDTAAYFAGSLFGKHHFSSISPNKTIEGSIAGLVAAIVVTTAGWQLLASEAASEKYTILFAILLGVIIGVFALAGDLIVSLIKRYFQVKDASDLIPGHGGVLDRFDSVFFVSPMVHLFISLVTRIIP